mmetsp:Transcript_4461/g.10846  ORF Transcript_4461/g.10846 Transcript_4461/m.10846 type:complete len:206 (-) Transcript_4461:60-677(-)
MEPISQGRRPRRRRSALQLQRTGRSRTGHPAIVLLAAAALAATVCAGISRQLAFAVGSLPARPRSTRVASAGAAPCDALRHLPPSPRVHPVVAAALAGGACAGASRQPSKTRRRMKTFDAEENFGTQFDVYTTMFTLSVIMFVGLFIGMFVVYLNKSPEELAEEEGEYLDDSMFEEEQPPTAAEPVASTGEPVPQAAAAGEAKSR